MAQPRVRHDVYGSPLPPLTDAHQESRVTHGHNPQIRRLLFELLNDQLDALLHRGGYGIIQLTCRVQNGLLQNQINITVDRLHHYKEDEP